MGVYRRGKWYWVRFRWRGQEIRRPARTTVRRTAVDYERTLREELAAIDRGGKPRRTFKELMVRFGREHWPGLKPSAVRRYRTSGRHLLAAFGDLYIDQINRARLADFVSKRRRDGASSATVRRDLACLSSALACAVRWDWLDHNPVRDFDKRGIPEARPRVRWLRPAEYRRLLAAAPDDLRAIVVMLVTTGLRLGELLALTWEDVDLKRREIHVRESKSGMPRMVPLADEARAQFRAQPQHLHCGHVVFTRNGKPYTVPAMSSRLARLLRRAKVKDFRAHDLRHTFASWYLQRGGDIVRLSKILGHKRLEQTMKYAHLATADLHRDMQRVGTKAGTAATDSEEGTGA